MHYYQHHIGDFTKDTANLDDHQLATYMRMLWEYYGHERPFVDDCERIAFAVRSNEKTVGLLLRHYFTLTPDGWRHKRCDTEISQYHAKADKARSSANARWRNANALPTHSERNANELVLDANQEPRTKNQEPVKKKSRSPEGSRLPTDWSPSPSLLQWTTAESPWLNVQKEAENFRDYWLAKPGKDGRKADWDATWRGWVRRSRNSSSQQPQQQGNGRREL